MTIQREANNPKKLEKTLYNKGWLNFHAIKNLGYAVNMIVSERGAKGKSFNAKEFIVDEYVNHGKTSGWVLNTVDMWEGENGNGWKTFIDKNREQYPVKWEGFVTTSSGIVDSITGKVFCRFLAISKDAKYKATGRNTPLDYLFYDEYNAGLRIKKSAYLSAMDSINNTFAEIIVDKNGEQLKDEFGDPLFKHPIIFFFGNNNSIAHPLLERHGVISLKKRFHLFVNGNQKVFMIYVPQDQISKIRKSTDYSAYRAFAQTIQTFDYSFGGLNTLENMNNVRGNKWFKTVYKNYTEWSDVLKLEEGYYKVYTNMTTLDNYVQKVALKEVEHRLLFTTKKKYIDIKGYVNLGMRDVFMKWFAQGKIFFDSQSTKIEIIKNL